MKAAGFLFLLIATEAAAEPGVGRLFFTPEERVRLEARQTDGLETPRGEALSPMPEDRRYQGFLRREGGSSVWWVDGRAVDATPPEARDASLFRETGRLVPVDSPPFAE